MITHQANKENAKSKCVGEAGTPSHHKPHPRCGNPQLGGGRRGGTQTQNFFLSSEEFEFHIGHLNL